MEVPLGLDNVGLHRDWFVGKELVVGVAVVSVTEENTGVSVGLFFVSIEAKNSRAKLVFVLNNVANRVKIFHFMEGLHFLNLVKLVRKVVVHFTLLEEKGIQLDRNRILFYRIHRVD